MANRSLSLIERLRIAYTVRRLNHLLSDLPARRRRAIKAELRDNLTAAAIDVGSATVAIERLGDLRRVAADYVEAEYGGEKHIESLRGVRWSTWTTVFVDFAAFVGIVAYWAGLDAAQPASGVYSWDFGQWLGFAFELRYDDGGFAGFELGLTVWWLVYPLVAFLIGARCWRASWIRRLLRADRATARVGSVG